MRSLPAAALAALLLAAPAAAQSPAPTVLSFDGGDLPGQYTATLEQRDAGCDGGIFHSGTGPHSAPRFLFAPCRPTLRLTFTVPKASVQLFARALVETAPQLVATGHTVTGQTVQVIVDKPSTWKPVSLAAPNSAFDYVELRAEGADIGVDDLAISGAPQPDSALTGGPPAHTEDSQATIHFAANRADVSGFRCELDGVPVTPCTSPITLTGLQEGTHRFTVAAIDAYGAVDPSPAEYVWTVLGPSPATPGPAPAMPDLPSVSGSDAADADQDRIPDSQEALPLGNVPPLAGVRTLVRLVSGAVYVKLPRVNPQQAGALPGFVPLKGIAALPVGTIVDARRGTLAIESARDGRPAGDPRRRLGRATLSQAIFQIRQARARRALLRARQIPTSFVLASAPDAERGCRARLPIKGVVRTFRIRASGLFRVSAGASRAEGRTATWRTTDRCTGTTTQVTRGKVTLYDRARRRTVTVKAGRRYVARARLFQARKGGPARDPR